MYIWMYTLIANIYVHMYTYWSIHIHICTYYVYLLVIGYMSYDLLLLHHMYVCMYVTLLTGNTDNTAGRRLSSIPISLSLHICMHVHTYVYMCVYVCVIMFFLHWISSYVCRWEKMLQHILCLKSIKWNFTPINMYIRYLCIRVYYRVI